MVVLILETVPTALRGDLARWLLELKAGVFVGQVSARVRAALWEKACLRSAGGTAMILYSADTEQGFAIDIWGVPSKYPDWSEGLIFIRENLSPKEQERVKKLLWDPPGSDRLVSQ